MGFSISWFAVREENAEQFFKSLALSPTGKTEEFPKSLIATAKLDTGWRVLWYNEYLCPFLRQDDLCRISADYDVLRCQVEEHVMVSSAELWSAGKRKWLVLHEGDRGPKGLESEGDLPQIFPEIRHEMMYRQKLAGGDEAKVDHLFEIPLKVAQSIVGFKHDEGCPHIVDNHFVVLSRPASSKGFWGRLFGRK